MSACGPEESPFWVKCGDCQHRWIAVWLPMELSRVGKLLKGLACPKCGAGSKSIFHTAPEPEATSGQ